MRLTFKAALAVACACVCAPAVADSFKLTSGITTDDVKVRDVRDGSLVVTLKNGREATAKLAEVQLITIDDLPKFTEAEKLRASNPAEAAKAYAAAIRTGGKAHKAVALARSISVLDAAGIYGDAVSNFLDVYAASPTQATWDLRPRTLPADAKSRYLTDAATAITQRMTQAPLSRDSDAQKNLNTMLLEIYNRQGNTAKAGEVAKRLGVDPSKIPDSPGAAETAVAVAPVGLGEIDTAFAAGKFEQVVASVDAALPGVKDEATGAKLFMVKAQSLARLKKFDEAAAAYLRVYAHFPARTSDASEALFAAALIQKQELKNDAEARRLGAEIKSRYEKTPAVEKAKRAGLL